MIQWVSDTLPRGCRELTSRQSKLHTVGVKSVTQAGGTLFNHTTQN